MLVLKGNSMEKVKELEKRIDNELQIFNEFEECLEQKQKLLIKNKVNELAEIDRRIAEFHQRIRNLEERRKLINKEFGSEDMLLSYIVKKIENRQDANRIEEKRKKILEIAEKISRKNKINEKLINHSLQLIEGSVKAISNALNEGNYIRNEYGRDGKMVVNTMRESRSSIIKEV